MLAGPFIVFTSIIGEAKMELSEMSGYLGIIARTSILLITLRRRNCKTFLLPPGTTGGTTGTTPLPLPLPLPLTLPLPPPPPVPRPLTGAESPEGTRGSLPTVLSEDPVTEEGALGNKPVPAPVFPLLGLGSALLPTSESVELFENRVVLLGRKIIGTPSSFELVSVAIVLGAAELRAEGLGAAELGAGCRLPGVGTGERTGVPTTGVPVGATLAPPAAGALTLLGATLLLRLNILL